MAKVRYENFSRKIFPGFYDSILSSNDQLDDDNYAHVPEGYWLDVADEDAYRQDACREWACAMESRWDSNPIGMKIGRFVGLWSPREYNFYTDKITVEIAVNLNRLKKYCWEERSEDFDQYLSEHWSSRSGFVSFMPNRLRAFKECYQLKTEKRSELVDIMIEWYLLEHIDFKNVEWDVYENLHEIICNLGVVLMDNEWVVHQAKWDNDTEQYVVGDKIA